MRIGIDLVIFRSYQGTEVFAENIIRALVENCSEHQIIIYKGYDQFSFFDQQSKILPPARLRVVNFRYFRNSLGVMLLQQIFIPFLVIYHRVNILYSPSPFFSFLAPVSKIHTIHDAAYARFREFRNIFSKIYINCSIQATGLCKYVVTVSQFSKQELISQLKIKPDRIVVVSEATPVLPTVPSELDSEILKKFNLQTKQYLIYLGSLNQRKNIAKTIQSFQHFRLQHPDYHLQFALAGNYSKNEQFELIAILGQHLIDHVIFLNRVSNQEKVILYRNSVGLLFISLYEGFGLPILEAQSVGVPVITSNIASMPEVAGDGAVYADPKSISSISDAIKLVVADEQLQANLVEKGFQNSSKFSWERSALLLKESLIHD